MNARDKERAEAIAKLREWIKPGDTVYTILRNVSRSGMSREIGIVLMRDGTDLHPNYLVAKALGARIGKRDGVIVGGCGMDMGFHVVYSLASCLFRQGFGCIGEGDGRGNRCPSNDHSNGDRDYRIHTAGNPTAWDGNASAYASKPTAWENPQGCAHWHRDGGYCLRHRRL